MFRQDRTNPSTAISNWRGRHDTPKAWPSTAVSTWLNGGLFGAAAMTAFGGIITQYTDSGTTYRVHTFRGSGKFVVSSGEADVDWLVIGGGGGGNNGGGGAGGMRTGTGVTVDVASSPYTITVGTGGPPGTGSNPTGANNGVSSVALGVHLNLRRRWRWRCWCGGWSKCWRFWWRRGCSRGFISHWGGGRQRWQFLPR